MTEQEMYVRWKFGDGFIWLTYEEAGWLIEQEGTPNLVWRVDPGEQSFASIPADVV